MIEIAPAAFQSHQVVLEEELLIMKPVSVTSDSLARLIKLGLLLITLYLCKEKPAHMIWRTLLNLQPPVFYVFLLFFMDASTSASSVLSGLSLCFSAGNSKQALRCKTCKLAAHLWCTSELSQQLCHGKVRIHTKNETNGSRVSGLVLLSLICKMLIECFFNLATLVVRSIHCCGVFTWHFISDSEGDCVWCDFFFHLDFPFVKFVCVSVFVCPSKLAVIAIFINFQLILHMKKHHFQFLDPSVNMQSAFCSTKTGNRWKQQ